MPLTRSMSKFLISFGIKNPLFSRCRIVVIACSFVTENGIIYFGFASEETRLNTMVGYPQ